MQTDGTLAAHFNSWNYVEFSLTTDMCMHSDLLRVELVKLCLQSVPPP